MKRSSQVFRKILSMVVVLALGASTVLWAQDQDQGAYAPAPNQQQPYPQQQPYDQQSPAEPRYASPQQNPALSPDELRNLVAPIALYPDALLSQILVASTYPQEVVDAGTWMQDHRDLRGRELMIAAQQQNWDPSVQALVAFPDVLARLNADVQWMTDLGNAFVSQQADVMNAIQDLRAEARARGQLRSTPQFQVNTETQGPRTVIEIVPTSPQVIYVPSYDPSVVWGAPVYGAYPAVPYAAGYGWGAVFTAIANVAELLPGFLGWLGPRSWGWALGWLANALFVNNGFFHSFGFHWGGGAWGSSEWVHDWHHRLGVPYGRRESVAYWHSRPGFNRGGWRDFGGSRGWEGARSSANYHAYGREGLDRGRDNGWRSFNNSRAGERRSSYGAARGAAAFPHTQALRAISPPSAAQSNRIAADRSWTERTNSSAGFANRRDSYAARNSGRSYQQPYPQRSYSGRSYSGRSSSSSFERGGSSSQFSERVNSRSFSSHAAKAPHYSAPKMKMPKAPKMAKAHGGGHSSGGHSSKKSHRG